MNQKRLSLSNLPEWIKNLAVVMGILSPIAAIVLFLIRSATAPDISAIQSQLAAQSDELVKLNTGLANTNNRIDTVLNNALNRAFPPAASVKPTKSQIEAATQIIEIAKAQKANINEDAVREFGTKVASLTDEPQLTDVAWAGLNAAVEYRSHINDMFVPEPAKHTQKANENGPYQFAVNVVGGWPGPETEPVLEIFTAGQQRDGSVRLESLNKPQRLGSGFAYFVVRGRRGWLGLDGMYLRNVVVSNAVVVYSGGPVRLENVYFVNCTFKLAETAPVRDFGTTVLQAANISFNRAG
jgi:hypothetical protein